MDGIENKKEHLPGEQEWIHFANIFEIKNNIYTIYSISNVCVLFLRFYYNTEMQLILTELNQNVIQIKK